MIKLANMLIESDEPRDPKKRVSREITMTQAIELIKNNCSEAVKVFSDPNHGLGKGLYRGYNADKKYCLYTDPATRERTGNNNLYNALTSILPSWQNFPPRSKSLMFSNNASVARTYGMTYWLFPFDGANIAHCTQRDCWYAFEYTAKRLGRQSSSIDFILNAFAAIVARSVLQTRTKNDMTSHWTSKAGRHFTNREYTISNTEKFLKELKRITPVLLKYCEHTISEIERSHIDFKIYEDILTNYKGDWTQYFDELLDPDKNNMARTTIPEIVNIEKDVELWTDAKCVMVNPTTDFNFYILGDSSICGTFFKQKIQWAASDNLQSYYGVKND